MIIRMSTLRRGLAAGALVAAGWLAVVLALTFVSPAGRDFEWLLGAYYIDESNDVRNQYLFPFVDDMFGLPADPTCCKLRLDGQANTEASAIFGSHGKTISCAPWSPASA